MDGHGGEGAGGSANGGSTNGGSVGDTLARKHSWALPLPRPNRPGVTVLVWGRNDLGQLGLGAATAAAAGGGGGEGAAPAPPSAVYVPTPVEVSFSLPLVLHVAVLKITAVARLEFSSQNGFAWQIGAWRRARIPMVFPPAVTRRRTCIPLTCVFPCAISISNSGAVCFRCFPKHMGPSRRRRCRAETSWSWPAAPSTPPSSPLTASSSPAAATTTASSAAGSARAAVASAMVSAAAVVVAVAAAVLGMGGRARCGRWRRTQWRRRDAAPATAWP